MSACDDFEGAQCNPALSLSSVPSLAAHAFPERIDEPDTQAEIVSGHPRLVATAAENNLAAQHFRGLAARLRQLQETKGLKRILITSSIEGEGKSVLAANLALTLARRQSVLLVDGDLRQSGLRELLGMAGCEGIADWWRGGADVLEFVCPLPGRDLSISYLPSGDLPDEPLEILQSQRMADLLGRVSERFDWVIIDSPPLIPLVDSHIWAAHADATLFVVRQGKTPKKLLKKALENSQSLKLLGFVVNDHEDAHRPYYGRYYAQQYGPRPTLPQRGAQRGLNRTA